MRNNQIDIRHKTNKTIKDPIFSVDSQRWKTARDSAISQFNCCSRIIGQYPCFGDKSAIIKTFRNASLYVPQKGS